MPNLRNVVKQKTQLLDIQIIGLFFCDPDKEQVQLVIGMSEREVQAGKEVTDGAGLQDFRAVPPRFSAKKSKYCL